MADAYPPDARMIERPASPWWLLARGIGAASDPRALVLAALGWAALRAGWAGLALAMGPLPWLDGPAPRFAPGFAGPMDRPIAATLGGVVHLFAPFVAMFRPDVPGWSRCSAALASLWTLVIWGLFGGAIVRVAVVRIARGGRVGIASALAASGRKLGSLVAAPLAPILVAVVIGLGGAAVGLLDRLPGTIGTSAATLLAFVPLIVGLLDAVILLGLVLAWPLMIVTVVAEGEDFFDAISRSYSYVNQRAARYVAYLITSAILGAVGLILFGLFIAAALGLADWSTSLGAPRGGGFRFLDASSADRSGLPVVAYFWNGAVETIASGWIYSYLWSSAAIIYLLLRLDVDGADIHDIDEPGREAEPFVPDESPAGPEPS